MLTEDIPVGVGRGFPKELTPKGYHCWTAKILLEWVQYSLAKIHKTEHNWYFMALVKRLSHDLYFIDYLMSCEDDINLNNLMHVKRKQTLRSLSLSYQKKDGAWTRPSFFWYDTDFSRI